MLIKSINASRDHISLTSSAGSIPSPYTNIYERKVYKVRLLHFQTT
jgi:hypothetical protein